MVALRAWYDPDDDDEPIIVSTTEDADTLIDRMASDRASAQVPPLMQLSRREPSGWAVLHIGINTDHGVLTYTDATGSFVTTNGAKSAEARLTYDYMGHLREVPANAEIPLVGLRAAVHEFVTADGARPTGVHWQPDE